MELDRNGVAALETNNTHPKPGERVEVWGKCPGGKAWQLGTVQDNGHVLLDRGVMFGVPAFDGWRYPEAVNTSPGDGRVLVPKEPDDGMIEAGSEAIADKQQFGMTIYAADIWRAMLAAAPTPTEKTDD